MEEIKIKPIDVPVIDTTAFKKIGSNIPEIKKIEMPTLKPIDLSGFKNIGNNIPKIKKIEMPVVKQIDTTKIQESIDEQTKNIAVKFSNIKEELNGVRKDALVLLALIEEEKLKNNIIETNEQGHQKVYKNN